MISVEAAHKRIIGSFGTIPAETVGIAEAAGRVLAADVAPRLIQPPSDLSAMDGYAVRFADVAAMPTRLRVVGQAPAGGSYDATLGAGEAVRIFTGGPLPAGADTIVIQENTRRDGDLVVILEPAQAGRHIRRAGLDFAPGTVQLRAGRRLGPRDLALLAAMNVPWVEVRRRPVVALLATGNELVLPGEPVLRNRIVASSGLALAAAVQAWGGTAVNLGIAPDDVATIGERIAAGARHDLVVTLGGASVGDHDLVQGALLGQGFALDFWKIAMRPGKPLMYAERAGAHGLPSAKILGLPGNPVSSLICALLFLKPAIERMLGVPAPLPATAPVPLAAPLGANDTREDYVRAVFEIAPSGQRRVRPFPVQDSSMLSVLAHADALIVRPAHDRARDENEPVAVIDLAAAGAVF